MATRKHRVGQAGVWGKIPFKGTTVIIRPPLPPVPNKDIKI